MQGIEAQFTAFTAAVQSRLETLQKDNSEQLEKNARDRGREAAKDARRAHQPILPARQRTAAGGLHRSRRDENAGQRRGRSEKGALNVKTRGIVGEYQLGALIDDILTRDQFEENVITKKGSTTRVEYAIKMPGEDGGFVYLPVDSKFPGDVYAQLVDAYDTGDPAAIAAAQAMLTTRIKGCAKDIRDKYIDPPNTTDFGIMFLPFEGLYAEVVRLGLVEVLQRQYKVNIAYPTTFAALLNSLQMGFRTLAIQKRSSEVERPRRGQDRVRHL